MGVLSWYDLTPLFWVFVADAMFAWLCYRATKLSWIRSGLVVLSVSMGLIGLTIVLSSLLFEIQ